MMENSTEYLGSGNISQLLSARKNNVKSYFFKQLQISSDIKEYSFMVIIPVGIVFNFITIPTFIKIKMYKTSTGLHLVCLALAEFLLLISCGLYWGRSYKFNYTKYIHCFLEYMTTTSLQTWSGFLMVSTTVERFVAVAFPMKVKIWNLKIFSKASISCFALVSLVLGGMAAATGTLVKGKELNTCGINLDFEEQNPIFSAFITNTTPVLGVCQPLLTFIFTVLIATQLYKQKKARNTMVQERSDHNSKKEFTITLMLFAVACMFLISKIFYMMTWFIFKYSRQNSPHSQQAIISNFYAQIIVIINHSVNSLVYVLFFKTFREGMKSVFFCKRQSSGNERKLCVN